MTADSIYRFPSPDLRFSIHGFPKFREDPWILSKIAEMLAKFDTTISRYGGTTAAHSGNPNVLFYPAKDFFPSLFFSSPHTLITLTLPIDRAYLTHFPILQLFF